MYASHSVRRAKRKKKLCTVDINKYNTCTFHSGLEIGTADHLEGPFLDLLVPPLLFFFGLLGSPSLLLSSCAVAPSLVLLPFFFFVAGPRPAVSGSSPRLRLSPREAVAAVDVLLADELELDDVADAAADDELEEVEDAADDVDDDDELVCGCGSNLLGSVRRAAAGIGSREGLPGPGPRVGGDTSPSSADTEKSLAADVLFSDSPSSSEEESSELIGGAGTAWRASSSFSWVVIRRLDETSLSKRFLMSSAWSFMFSTAIVLQPARIAAIDTVPEPENASKTQSPALHIDVMNQYIMSTGKAHGTSADVCRPILKGGWML